jgi:hypothetical protein
MFYLRLEPEYESTDEDLSVFAPSLFYFLNSDWSVSRPSWIL